MVLFYLYHYPFLYNATVYPVSHYHTDIYLLILLIEQALLITMPL